MRARLILLTFLFISSLGLAQQGKRSASKRGTIYGSIISEGEELPFASVSVFSQRDSSLITGSIADEKGKFLFSDIPYGRYYLSVSFVGYENFVKTDIAINERNSVYKIEKIELKPSLEALKEVEISSTLPAIEYQIDKKVVNVDKQIAATSGSAVDVLQNVPAVQVSADGNVTLRGSSGFMVFIDGRPSVLTGSEALNQIPASTIDKIELITNPSAKWDPDGTSGIINIVTKKNTLEGFSGVVNARGGSFGNFGGDGLLQFRSKKFNYFIGADYNYRQRPGIQRITRRTASNDTVFLTYAEGENESQSERYQIKGGLESQLSARDFFSVSGSFGYRNYYRLSELDYIESTLPFTSPNYYLSRNEHQRAGAFYSVTGDYEHQFTQENHKISGQVVYNWRNTNERNDNELIEPDGYVASGQQSTENGPGEELRFRVDYTLPLSKNHKLEFGSQYRMQEANDTNKVYNLNNSSNDYEFQPLFSNSVRYNRDIYAGYGIYQGKSKDFGYQVGLRTEYTGRFINKLDGDSSASLYRWDFFPSAHFSYQLPNDHQLMFSYSRRIERPRGWYFEPFITWVDAFNVRQGNPDLQPEYINSFELGWNKKVKKTLFSLETYYRQVLNKIERFRSVYKENIMLTTYQNVGTDHSLGVEGMISMDVLKWWNVDLLGNLYYFRGDYTVQNLNNTSVNWNTRFNNTFYLTKTTQFQINSQYFSAQISAQGRIEDFYVLNSAIKQNFMKNKLSLTLQANDILQSTRRQYTSEGEDFFTEEYKRNLGPIVMLNLAYRINNYKVNRRNRDAGGGGEEF